MTTQYGVFPPVGGSQPLVQAQFTNANPVPLTVAGGVVTAALPLSAVAAGASQAKISLTSVTDGLLALLTVGDLSASGALSVTSGTGKLVGGNASIALTTGNLTETTSSVLTITGGTNAQVGGGTTIQVAQASTSQAGYLSSTDWNTFNGKVATTRSMATTAPLTGGGDLSANRTLSIAKATGSVDGYLAGTDFTTFAAKEPAVTAGTSAQYYRGDKTFVALNQAAVAGLTTADNVTFASVTSPGTVNGASGVFSGSTSVGASTLTANAYGNAGTPTIFEVTNSGTATTSSAQLNLSSAGVASSTNIGTVTFAQTAATGTASQKQAATILAQSEAATTVTANAALKFYTNNGTALAERLRIKPSGALLAYNVMNNSDGQGTSASPALAAANNWQTTASNFLNCALNGAYSGGIWSRVGNIVTASCRVSVNCTTAGTIAASISLPFGTADKTDGATYNGGGNCGLINGNYTPGIVYIDTASTARFILVGQTVTTNLITIINFQYSVA